MFSKNIQQLFLAAAVTLAACAPLAGQRMGQSLTGAWLTSITVDGEPAPFANDIAVFDARGSFRIIPSDKGESEAAGSYQRTGNREFNSTHVHILYNDKGGYSGVAKVIAVFKVNEAGDAFAGRYRVEILDAAGKTVATVTGTITAKMVVAEPL